MQDKQLLYEILREKGKEYAKAKAKYEMLDESKKSVLATQASLHDWSEAYRERMARQSKAYKDYLVWVAQARQEELELKYEIDSIVMHFEYYRTQEASKRAEIKLL